MLHRTRQLFIRQQDLGDQCHPWPYGRVRIVAPVGRRGVEALLEVVADVGDNVGRQKIELAVKHLSYGLLRLHCEDLDAGASPANSKVYDHLKDYWTLQDLLASGLWTKMDQKVANLGGCSAIPGEQTWTG
jgi:hypothetical protein